MLNAPEPVKTKNYKGQFNICGTETILKNISIIKAMLLLIMGLNIDNI